MNKRAKLNLDLYKRIYLIRQAEKTIIENYGSDEMKTPMHMSMGEEAIVAGVCSVLALKDQVLGTYRSHGLYLAKTGETDKFFAEMYGKVTGVVRGKGGSMHLSSPESGFLMSSAVVASTIPVAIGAAYSNKVQKNGKFVAVFFGDGALDEGVFWESLNFACLMKLPILFVCEDNDLAVHTSVASRHGYTSISKIVSKFDCNVFQEKTTDAEVIYNLTKAAVLAAKRNSMPSFMHLFYYRYLEHVGINEDFEAGYRDKKEYEDWLKVDPVVLQRKKLRSAGFDEKSISRLESKIDKQIEKSIKLAKDAPFAQRKELYQGVFSEKR